MRRAIKKNLKKKKISVTSIGECSKWSVVCAHVTHDFDFKDC